MKFLREPLVHFLLLGGLLFAVFALAGGGATGSGAATDIVITPGQVENLRLSAQRTSGHDPDPAALQQAIDAYVREEIYAREARALGLDQDDPVVRLRLQQRMEFLAENAAETRPPTDAELQAYFVQHQSDFKAGDAPARTLAEVRPAVVVAWQDEQRKQAAEAAYQKLRQKYKVTVRPLAGTRASTPVPASAPGTAAAPAPAK